MTIQTTKQREREAESVREELQRAVRLTHEAVDALDVGLGISLLRGLRSTLWRAKAAHIDVTAVAPEPVSETQGERT